MIPFLSWTARWQKEIDFMVENVKFSLNFLGRIAS